MKHLSHTRSRRDTALMVLLVWLFALASGVANACLLEVRQTHSHVAATESFDTAPVSVIVPAHTGAVFDESPVGEARLNASCLKVCDDSTRSFPNPVSTVVHADPGPAPLVVVLWSATAPDVPALRQIDAREPAMPGLPVRVRFSRLAI